MEKTCVFCDLRKSKQRIVLENESVFVMPTNIPIVPGHLLLCPIRCVATFEELSEKEKIVFEQTRLSIKKALVKTFGAEGFNYAWNEGSMAGQSIPHLHLHILPRKTGDAGITEYEPRKFLYRPGSREPSPEIELQFVAELIKKNL
jgi:diadenosine tetraphosphate (Ap4A) HIT family hydrolase